MAKIKFIAQKIFFNREKKIREFAKNFRMAKIKFFTQKLFFSSRKKIESICKILEKRKIILWNSFSF